MVELIKRLSGFLGRMDVRGWTSLLVSIVLLAFVVFMLFFGQRWLNLENEDQLGRLMFAVAESPWAVVGVISIFALVALTGFPQIFLIMATVLVFGPVDGAVYSWIATMVSATLTFALGHALGGRWVKRIGDARVQSLIGFLERHGVIASALIRIVPSAPFIVVNAAAGVAHIPMWKYWLGTGIGIIPKIVTVAALGALTPSAANLSEGLGGVVDFFTSREPTHLALLALIVGAWIGLLILVRRIYVRLRGAEENSGKE